MNQPVPWDDNSDGEDLDAREPWMWGGKRAFVFLIDASEPMFALDVDNKSYFMECIKACKNITLKKIVQDQKDLIGVVLFGTSHKDQAGIPDYVMTLQNIELPSAENLKALKDIEMKPDDYQRKIGHSKDFSIGEALWHCNKLINNCKTKLFEKTILLLTSTDDPHSKNPNLQLHARRRASDLSLANINLKVLSFGLKFNMKIFYQDLIDNAYGDGSSGSTGCESMDDILKNFERSIAKRSIGKVVWALGENVKLAVGVYTSCRAASMPKKVKIERTKNDVVKSSVQYFNANSGEEVLRSDVVKTAKVAGETVMYDPDEFLAAKQISPPGLVLLGFKPTNRIDVYNHMKTSLFLYPEEGKIKGSRTLFAALHAQCLKREVAALCYFTARRSSRPELVALIPQKENLSGKNIQLVPPGFSLIFLPFADNIRNLDKYVVQCPDPELQLLSLAKQILKKINFEFDPMAIDNPRLATHWAGITALALNDEDEDVPVDHTLLGESIDKNISSLAEKFMNLSFPEGFNEKKIASSSKAKHALENKESSNPKKTKVELDPANMEDIAKNGLVEKLKVDQLKNFLIETGMKVSKMKKNELVKAVYDHFGMDQPE